MKLFDKNDEFLSNIVLSDSYDVFLEKNSSKYEIIINKDENDNTYMAIFDKSYIDSLSDDDYIDNKNMIACIEWDILEKKSDLGVALLTLFEDVNDITPLLLFAASTFLLYKSNNDSEKRKMRNSFLIMNNMINEY